MSLVNLHKALVTEWAKPQKDIAAVSKKLDDIDKLLQTDEGVAQLQATDGEVLRRDVLEISTLVALRKGDFELFDSTLCELLAHYSISKNVSPQKNMMIGLDLMNKLAFGKVREFHLTMCQYEHHNRNADPYLSFPEKLEECLSLGLYTRVAEMKHTAPSPEYQQFFDILLTTARERSAEAIERSYSTIRKLAAAKLLFYDGPNAERDVTAYGETRRWISQGKNFVFPQVGEAKMRSQAESLRVNSSNLIGYYLDYAKQLENIV